MKRMPLIFKDPLYVRLCSFFTGLFFLFLGGLIGYVSYIELSKYIWVIPCMFIALFFVLVGLFIFLFAFSSNDEDIAGNVIFFFPNTFDLFFFGIQLFLFLSVGLISLILTFFIRLFIPNKNG